MAGSTSNLDLISSSQASKEVTANALFDAGSPATIYGRRASTTSALTWGFYGGMLDISGAITSIANGTVALTASATNYIVASRATGVVSKSTATTNWNDSAGYIRLYSVVAGASTITSYLDYRAGAYTKISSGSAAVEINFAFGDATPSAITTAAAGKLIYGVSLHIKTPFDGTGAALTVGDAGQFDRLMTSAENDPYTVGGNESHPSYAYGTNTAVVLSITPGAGATQGAGVLILYIQN